MAFYSGWYSLGFCVCECEYSSVVYVFIVIAFPTNNNYNSNKIVNNHENCVDNCVATIHTLYTLLNLMTMTVVVVIFHLTTSHLASCNILFISLNRAVITIITHHCTLLYHYSSCHTSYSHSNCVTSFFISGDYNKTDENLNKMNYSNDNKKAFKYKENLLPERSETRQND